MKKFKKIFAGLMAVASLAVGMTGISASAYSGSGSIMRDAGAPGGSDNLECSWSYTTSKATSTLTVSNFTATYGSTYLDSSITCGSKSASNDIYTTTTPKTVVLKGLTSGKAAYANSYVVNVSGTIRATVTIDG